MTESYSVSLKKAVHVFSAGHFITLTDDICEAVLGEGHFLGGDQTLAAMERDYFYPPLADRDDPSVWGDSGAPTAWDRAKRKAREVLETHQPQYLTAEHDAQIRAQFNIIL